MEAAASKQAIIKSMREDFYTTFFQSYGDRAAQKTATESAQDFAQTTQAFLSMLATSINEAENEIMWRVEQAYEPARPNLWGSAHVAWTKNFASVQDPNERINSLVDRTMPGGKVPASVETMRSIITEWYDRHGFDVSDEGQQEELLELIRTAQDRESQQDSLFRRLRVRES